ncbi:DegT/DnrJ/EryC1/StrS aminotransferase family protein [Candidatus Woesearchaeota archaeon]|nr:DegT/DnrJ/EryC1/StrS aminotransferase family protein [Candidatus Woesearchaeota archaeon]
MTDDQEIPLTRPFFGPEELDAVRQSLASGWVAGQGSKNAAFAKAFAAMVPVAHAVPVNNCTAALHLSLLSLGVTAGDEVLVADYSYPATSHAVVYCGATPRFVDVREDTYNIDPGLIEAMLTPRTKAIIPVHTFGQAAEMDRITAVAKRHGIAVVEDAACAAGASYAGKNVGSFGDLACFSFHARKNATTGEGGMVTTESKDLFETVSSLACFGIESALSREKEFSVPRFTRLGYNYKLSDINAAIGIEQLKKLPLLITRRRELARLYDGLLEDVGGVAVPVTHPKAKHIYQSYVVLLDDAIDRDRVIVALRKRGIQAQIGTYSCSVQPVYRTSDRCPVSERVFGQALALPMYYGLVDSQAERVISELRAVLGERHIKKRAHG